MNRTASNPTGRAAPTMETASVEFPDGRPCHVRWWRPAKPRGAVLCLHGIQSHGGWYEASCSRLAEAGFAVLMPDRRGSGANGAPRGHYDSLDQCVSDTRHFLQLLLDQTGFASAHLIGISWGGKQVVELAMSRPGNVKSISLIAPGLFPRVDLSPLEKFRVGLSMVNERTKLFDIPLNDARFFTNNPERINWLEQDRLKLLQVSASFLLTSRRLDKTIRGFGQSDYRGAVHLFLAGRDVIIDNEATRRWFEALPFADRMLTFYEHAQHTLEFEADGGRYFSDLVSWISARA